MSENPKDVIEVEPNVYDRFEDAREGTDSDAVVTRLLNDALGDVLAEMPGDGRPGLVIDFPEAALAGFGVEAEAVGEPGVVVELTLETGGLPPHAETVDVRAKPRLETGVVVVPVGAVVEVAAGDADVEAGDEVGECRRVALPDSVAKRGAKSETAPVVVPRLDFCAGDDGDAFVGGVVVEAGGLGHVTVNLLLFDLYYFAVRTGLLVV